MDCCRLYPEDEKPSIWYIDHVVRQAGLQARKPKSKRRGGLVYLPVEEVDRENKRFNAEGREFFQFRYKALAQQYQTRCLLPSRKIETEQLRSRRNKKISFIRFVGPSSDEPRAHITVMNQRVYLPEAYTHQFVFATWDLQAQQLAVVSEFQGTVTSLLRIPFKINE